MRELHSNGKASVEKCCRHLIVLEENAVMEATYPGKEIINYLSLFHDVVNAQLGDYERGAMECKQYFLFHLMPSGANLPRCRNHVSILIGIEARRGWIGGVLC